MSNQSKTAAVLKFPLSAEAVEAAEAPVSDGMSPAEEAVMVVTPQGDLMAKPKAEVESNPLYITQADLALEQPRDTWLAAMARGVAISTIMSRDGDRAAAEASPHLPDLIGMMLEDPTIAGGFKRTWNDQCALLRNHFAAEEERQKSEQAAKEAAAEAAKEKELADLLKAARKAIVKMAGGQKVTISKPAAPPSAPESATKEVCATVVKHAVATAPEKAVEPLTPPKSAPASKPALADEGEEDAPAPLFAPDKNAVKAFKERISGLLPLIVWDSVTLAGLVRWILCDAAKASQDKFAELRQMIERGDAEEEGALEQRLNALQQRINAVNDVLEVCYGLTLQDVRTYGIPDVNRRKRNEVEGEMRKNPEFAELLTDLEPPRPRHEQSHRSGHRHSGGGQPTTSRTPCKVCGKRSGQERYGGECQFCNSNLPHAGKAEKLHCVTCKDRSGHTKYAKQCKACHNDPLTKISVNEEKGGKGKGKEKK